MSLYFLCVIILTIAPTFLLGAYIYNKDIYEKESTKLLTRLFLAGILSTFLTLFISYLMETIFPFFASDTNTYLYYSLGELFIYVFVGIALVEEFSKWIFVKKIAWKNKEFNYLYDAIVYSVFVSLGFATLENVLYVLTNSTAFTVILRAILAVPSHAFNGVFMGYYLGLAKAYDINNQNKLSKKNLILSLVIPILSHGIYDYLLYATSVSEMFLILFAIFIIFLYIMAFMCIKKVSKSTYTFNNEQTVGQAFSYCPVCHNSITNMDIYCRNCGRRLR